MKKMIFRIGRAVAAMSLFVTAAAVAAEDYRSHPAFAEFTAQLSQHGFTPRELDALFEGVTRQQKILDAISRPAESRDWHEYRPIFITETRINAGAEFWREHAETLARAEQKFDVDAEFIVAIIGVETFYGRITGSWRVIDALATLGFDYPPRSRFFSSELQHFLLLTREEAIDPKTVSGSYAGAMGGGQFMPSSYREYAVDFDGDGRRNLWNSWPDVIGSVANYLSRHGWVRGETVAVPAAIPDGVTPPLAAQGMEVFAVKTLRDRGVVFSKGIAEGDVRLVALKHEDELRHWIGLENFRVITRYNRSPLYAMAVIELARAIQQEVRPGT